MRQIYSTWILDFLYWHRFLFFFVNFPKTFSKAKRGGGISLCEVGGSKIQLSTATIFSEVTSREQFSLRFKKNIFQSSLVTKYLTNKQMHALVSKVT